MRLSFLLLFIFIAVLINGCGGSGSASNPIATPSPAPSFSPSPSPTPGLLPTGLGIYRAKKMLDGFTPYRFLDNGTVYGWSVTINSSISAGKILDLTSLNFERYRYVSDTGIVVEPDIPQSDSGSYVVNANGDFVLNWRLFDASTGKTIDVSANRDAAFFALDSHKNLYSELEGKYLADGENYRKTVPLYSDERFTISGLRTGLIRSNPNLLSIQAEQGIFVGVIGRYDSLTDVSLAAYCQEGRVVNLQPLFPGKNSQAFALLRSGDIVGANRDNAGIEHLVLWHNGVPSDLGSGYKFENVGYDNSIFASNSKGDIYLFQEGRIIPVVAYDDRGNKLLLKQILASLSDHRAVGATHAYATYFTDNYILTPTW